MHKGIAYLPVIIILAVLLVAEGVLYFMIQVPEQPNTNGTNLNVTLTNQANTNTFSNFNTNTSSNTNGILFGNLNANTNNAGLVNIPVVNGTSNGNSNLSGNTNTLSNINSNTNTAANRNTNTTQGLPL